MEEPEFGLLQVWQAVLDRSQGQRDETRSVQIQRLKAVCGSTWVKKHWAIFQAFREHGVREIAPGQGYIPRQEDRDRGIFAPSEIRGWLGSYASKDLNEHELRRLLTWHRRWERERGEVATTTPSALADGHIGGVLRARARLQDRLRVPEPMRVAEDLFSRIWQLPPDPRFAEEVGRDPSLDQLQLHVPDNQLWNQLDGHCAAVSLYEDDVREAVHSLEAQALARTGARRGYGHSSSGFGPGEGIALAIGFTLGPLDHAFALLDGNAPAGWRSQITPWPQHPSAFKLVSGWRQQQLEDVAVGDEDAMRRVRRVQHEMDDSLLRSEELRNLWNKYQRLNAESFRLVALVNGMDEQRINIRHCWGCPKVAALVPENGESN